MVSKLAILSLLPLFACQPAAAPDTECRNTVRLLISGVTYNYDRLCREDQEVMITSAGVVGCKCRTVAYEPGVTIGSKR